MGKPALTLCTLSDMRTNAETRLVKRLIADDETKVATLTSKIIAATENRRRAITIRRRMVIDVWERDLKVLGHGLEGLKLKHDALRDLEN